VDQAQSDTARMQFKVRTRTVEYGDERKFIEYRIHLFKGTRIVGVESGPQRQTSTRSGALKAARTRIAELKKHRLFAIKITRRHIRDGTERNCDYCAIAQALYHNQERMGLPRHKYNLSVEPYGFFSRVRGIVISPTMFSNDDHDLVLPADDMPQIVLACDSKGNPYPDSMVEWAMRFDDWGQARHETLSEYRERTGDDEGKPYRPGPASFVLDLDAFQSDGSGT
jgi:hypothetical protein